MAATSWPTSRQSKRCAMPRPASSICSTAWVFPSIARPKACSTFALRRTLYNRTAFAGATTGQQLLYALDEQVRRYESEGKVKKYEHWSFSLPCSTEPRLPRHLRHGSTQHGGANVSRGRHHYRDRRQRRAFWQVDELRCVHRLAQSALYQQGAYYANGEFIQVHPTCIPGEDKLRLMSESAPVKVAACGPENSRR